MLYLKLKRYYGVLYVCKMTHNIPKKNCIFVIKFIGGPRGFLLLGRLCSIREYTPLLSWHLCALTTLEYSVYHTHLQANVLQMNVLENELNRFWWFWLFFNAFFMARCRNCSLRWWRLIFPERGSTERFRDGKTYCQPHSLSAFGYFRASAKGRDTLPYPFFRSLWCWLQTFFKCSFNGCFRISGKTVIRSLWPFPSRTMICMYEKSMSLILSFRHSIRRNPAPYIILAINHLSPVRCRIIANFKVWEYI